MEDFHELRLVPEDELPFGNVDLPYVLTTITKTTKQGLLWIVKNGDKESCQKIINILQLEKDPTTVTVNQNTTKLSSNQRTNLRCLLMKT